jgi:hypothetical protein
MDDYRTILFAVAEEVAIAEDHLADVAADLRRLPSAALAAGQPAPGLEAAHAAAAAALDALGAAIATARTQAANAALAAIDQG